MKRSARTICWGVIGFMVHWCVDSLRSTCSTEPNLRSASPQCRIIGFSLSFSYAGCVFACGRLGQAVHQTLAEQAAGSPPMAANTHPLLKSENRKQR